VGEQRVGEVQMIRILAISLAVVSVVAGGEGLLDQDSIAKAKDVKVLIFNQKSGKPAGNIGYHSLERKRPKLGPLTVNLQILRITNFRVEVLLDESEAAGFNDQMARYMEASALRFVEAAPASFVALQDKEVAVKLNAGRAKYDRRGGVFLADGVMWEIDGKPGNAPEARLVYAKDSEAWRILDLDGKLLHEFALKPRK